MAALRTELVKPRHEYTRVDLPWMMDTGMPDEIALHGSGVQQGRLFIFLSGGGLKAFGRPSRQMLRLRRQKRFLHIAGFAAVVWLLLFFL